MTVSVREQIELEHLFDLTVELEAPQVLATPAGIRMTYVVRSGRVRGERVNAELLPGGGDWLMIGNDGIGRLDVRATMRLDDGALVHLTTTGVAVLSDEAKGRLASGERVREHEMHARSQLRFEADPAGPHAWLNAITTVAINELAPNRVDYRVFRVL